MARFITVVAFRDRHGRGPPTLVLTAARTPLTFQGRWIFSDIAYLLHLFSLSSCDLQKNVSFFGCQASRLGNPLLWQWHNPLRPNATCAPGPFGGKKAQTKFLIQVTSPRVEPLLHCPETSRSEARTRGNATLHSCTWR